MALVRPETLPEERPVDRDASWHALDALPELALDHAVIVDDGLWRLHARVADKVWFVRKALALLTEPFTLRQAQQLYEALRGEEVDAANFRRDVRATGLLEDTGLAALGGPGPPGPPVPARLTKDSPSAPKAAAGWLLGCAPSFSRSSSLWPCPRRRSAAPPTVAFTAPAATAVSGPTTITVEASDDVAVTKVEFRVRGILRHVDTERPTPGVFLTGAVPDGPAPVKATAFDADGNTTDATLT